MEPTLTQKTQKMNKKGFMSQVQIITHYHSAYTHKTIICKGKNKKNWEGELVTIMTPQVYLKHVDDVIKINYKE